MDKYQKAGWMAIWEIAKPMLVCLAAMAVLGGISAMVGFLAHSVTAGILTFSVSLAVAIWGYLFIDTYRRGVRNARREEEYEAERAKRQEEYEAERARWKEEQRKREAEHQVSIENEKRKLEDAQARLERERRKLGGQ